MKKCFQHDYRYTRIKNINKAFSCECKCKFDGTKYKLNKWWNNDKCWYGYKKYHICEKDYVWNPSTCDCENGKYLTIIMNDSTIISDEVTDSCDEEIKTIQTNFNKKSNL